jgi:DNA primase
VIREVLEYYGWDGRAHGYGDDKNIKCPFHGDRHASGRINEAKEVFYCNACGVAGDAYKLVMDKEGLTFDQAKRRVQEIAGSDGSQLPGKPASGFFRSRGSSKLPKWARDKHKRRLSVSDWSRQL